MKKSQNDSGRSFEFGIASSLANLLPASIEDNKQIRKGKISFDISSEHEQNKIRKASHEICSFLIAHDKRLADVDCSISIQSDQKGKDGDVRDIVVLNSKLNEEIGISAKNRHYGVKASRLSELIDFGTDWMNIRCSDQYFNSVIPIFKELKLRKTKGEFWRDILDKKDQFYSPILLAFEAEMISLFELYPNDTAKALVQYLLGKHDYYKVIKQNGTVSATSFNINGTLRWGSKMPLPTRITDISMKPNSKTTLFMTFDKGWSLAFRIHNASTGVEPSLKFDITIVGMPGNISRHEIEYLRS